MVSRLALSALVAAGTLLLGGCSEENPFTGVTEYEEPAEEETSTAPAEGEGGGGALDGTWATGLDDSDSVLTFYGDLVSFTEAIAFETDTAFCSGTLRDDSVSFSCDTADEEWTVATITREGETLAVEWESGLGQTYERVADGEIPGL